MNHLAVIQSLAKDFDPEKTKEHLGDDVHLNAAINLLIDRNGQLPKPALFTHGKPEYFSRESEVYHEAITKVMPEYSIDNASMRASLWGVSGFARQRLESVEEQVLDHKDMILHTILHAELKRYLAYHHRCRCLYDYTIQQLVFSLRENPAACWDGELLELEIEKMVKKSFPPGTMG